MDPFLGTALPPLIVVSADDIAERAYAIYEERVRADGHDRERTGLRAERERRGASDERAQTASIKLNQTIEAQRTRSNTENRAPR